MDLRRDLVDGWGKPLRIVHQGDPVSSYLIASAGEDDAFDTHDDIAIRFSTDHEQLARINTFGVEEIEAEIEFLSESSDGAD